MSIVEVRDGETTWLALKAELVAELDRLGFEKMNRGGQSGRYDPVGDDDGAMSAYADLCNSVQPLDEGDPSQIFEWTPSEGCWLWSHSIPL